MTKPKRPFRGLMNREIREKYWTPLEGRHKTGAWEALDAGYTESHRAYHTWEHVAGLLEKLSEFSDLATRSDIIAVSVFWHDVVYTTQDQDGGLRPDYENVRDSGKLFRQYTLLNKSDADAVHDLIMATANHLRASAEKHYYAGFADDLDLFLDLDLSSLASPRDEFAEDFARIRTEFSWAPEVVFCSSQLRILENFAQPHVRLYRRAETGKKWCDAASTNLKRCIAELQKRLPNFLLFRGERQSTAGAIRKNRPSERTLKVSQTANLAAIPW
jgi:predicted metal-dependent HD superfamily phosphohydrolase